MGKTWKLIGILAMLTLPVGVSAATLSISPASGTFDVGERVVVRVTVSSGTPINAISAKVSFPTQLFTIESVSRAGSILNFWVTEPKFSSVAGSLEFEGVTLGGFNGGTGTVVTATLKAIKPGSAAVIVNSGQVLANDGQGTDVTDGLSGALFSVVPSEVPPPPKEIEESVIEPEQPLPSLDAPQIRLSREYGEQVIVGASDYGNSKVLLTFISSSGVKIFITGQTSSDGGFVLAVPKSLKSGNYKVTAVVIKNDLTNSRDSNELVIKLGNLLSDLRPEIRWAILALLIILIILLVRSYQYLTRNRKLKFFLRREAKEAEGALHDAFKSMKKDVDSRKLAKKDLDNAEKLIEKEIEDIEKL